jgi:2-phospho-L-lactate guanylyltransferase
MPREPGPRIAGIEAGVVLPLRSFTHGKARLARELDASHRAQFVRDMADRVVDAAGARPVVVVSSAAEVLGWAGTRELVCIDDPGTLDGAAESGRVHLQQAGCRRVVIAHGDLPLARTFEPVIAGTDARTAVIVPDHRDDGTPVLSIPSDVEFAFSYGPGSFARHCDAAARAGLVVRVLRDPSLGFDVDLPDDLARLDANARCP